MSSVFHILNPSPAHYSWVKATTDANAAALPWGWVSREHPQHLETQVDWALKEGVKRIVAWGGDGTFHRVVRRLWQKKALGKVELGLIPNGTCNDLARHLGLSKYLWRRWESDAPEVSRLASLSLCRVAWKSGSSWKEDVFVNNAGFGRPRSSFEKKAGPWGVLKSFQPIPLTARWEAGQLDGIYYMVLACNAPFFSGGLYFERDLSPEDDKLQLYLVPATSKIRLALRLLLGRLGRPLADRKVSKISTQKITLEAGSPVWPQADGEAPPEDGVRVVEFSVLPEKVRIWRPE